MGSTRFPGKPLVDLVGKPMVQWVYEAAVASGVGERVLVATPDDEILDAVHGFGGEAIRTRADHPSGTDRIAEVSESVVADVYVNVQGDEPLIPSASIKACAEPLLKDASIQMGTLWVECDESEYDDPAAVKLVTDLSGHALYFSRYAIPFARNPRGVVKRHVGIYAYRREVVQAFAMWPMSDLERTESLEQLRFLENGVRIMASYGPGSPMGVDTPEQADRVRQMLTAGN